VRVASDPGDLAGAVEVRRAVFVQEQGVPEELEMDDLDALAVHLAALSGRQVVGTARLYPDGSVWHIGRVAVLAHWRGQGIGQALMRLAEQVAADRGASKLTLNAQLPVVEFYLRLGYQVVSEPFLEAGIAHRTMDRPV
jgi:putative N-acetyltransferase (TIGR04045 family)